MSKITVAEYLEMIPRRPYYYKGLEVLEVIPTNDPEYVLLSLQVPLPYGGMHHELVDVNEPCLS